MSHIIEQGHDPLVTAAEYVIAGAVAVVMIVSLLRLLGVVR